MTEERDGVAYSTRDHIAYVVLNRPGRRNAMSRATMARLIEVFSLAGADPDVRVLVLTGTGEQAFCAGADLKEINQVAVEGRRLATPMTGPAKNVFESLLEVYKPTIAALNGPAVAGGAELTLACDLRIAADHAYVALPEAQRGMGANFANVLLPRLLPRGIALEMLYTGRRLSAEEGLRLGFFQAVHPREELAARADSLASQIASNAPLTVQRYSEMATKGWELPVSVALRLNVGPNPYLSADREEGVRAYVEKRAPRWEGR